MAKNDIINYINKIHKNGDVLKDDLWKQGKVFSLFDKNWNKHQLEAYGSYNDNNSEYNPANKTSSIKLYDLDEKFDEFDGHRIKEFFMVDSLAVAEFMDEIKNNPNCSYVTQFNELIKSGYIPKKVPTLVMQDDWEWQCNDILGSRLLNLFEVPTVYNFKLLYKTNSNFYNYEDRVVCSLDFLGENQKFIVLRDYLENFANVDVLGRAYDESIQRLIEDYKLVYETHYKKVAEVDPTACPTDEEKAKELKRWEEDLCYSTLCRCYGLADSDFSEFNCGVIIDEESKKISIAPSFDLEYACGGHNKFLPNRLKDSIIADKFLYIDSNGKGDRILYYINNLKNPMSDKSKFLCMLSDLEYISQNHPQVLQKFIHKVDEIMACDENGKSKLDSYLDEYYNYSSDEFKENLICVRDICEAYYNNDMQDCMLDN